MIYLNKTLLVLVWGSIETLINVFPAENKGLEILLFKVAANLVAERSLIETMSNTPSFFFQ